jgi:hypothetical protein
LCSYPKNIADEDQAIKVVLDIPSALRFRYFFGKDAKREFQSKK